MPYVKTFDRSQLMMCTWDDMVDPESIARLIDAFVDSLDLAKLQIKEAAKEGRPPYDPRGMLKLYVYGSRKGIRSSRKLEESCRINLEAKWLMGGAEPDFRTISDFRKDNVDTLKEIFHEFNRRLAGAVDWGFASVDGSKFAACNSKDRNFTKSKLEDRIKWLDAHTEEYLRILREMDEGEEGPEESLTRDMLEKRLKEAKERLERYQSYQKRMEEEGLSQLSLTDPDAKLMKSKNGFAVAYNPQTAVDSNTHLIRGFEMTNQATDHGLLYAAVEGIRNETEEAVLEAVADKGYENKEDMVRCLEAGILPHVIPEDGKDGFELELPYEEAEADASGKTPEEIKKTLRSGRIPEAYRDGITKIEVAEVRRKATDNSVETPAKSIYGTQEQMKARAMEGYFVRDPKRNLVYCPAGETLRQKCIKPNGNIRYANKNACRHCKNRNRCYQGRLEWKEIDFTKDGLEKPCRGWANRKNSPAAEQAPKKKCRYEKIKIVRLFLRPDPAKTSQRMCLSEHPFGTMKRAMNGTYFLLKGIRKVSGEFALLCLGYNLERAKNLLGFGKMMELMAAA